MSDAPERIWAYSWTGKEGRAGQWSNFDTTAYGPCSEYVRADLVDALVSAAKREALMEVEAHLLAKAEDLRASGPGHFNGIGFDKAARIMTAAASEVLALAAKHEEPKG